MSTSRRARYPRMPSPRRTMAAVVTLIAATATSIRAETTRIEQPVTTETSLEVAFYTGTISVRGDAVPRIRVTADHPPGDPIRLEQRGRGYRLVATSWASGADQLAIAGERIVIRHGADGVPPGMVDYEIVVPLGLPVRVRGVAGTISVDDLAAAVEIELVDGSVVLRELTDRVRVTSAQGTVEADRLRGRLEVEGGRSQLTVRNGSGDLTLRTTSGDIRLEAVTSEAASVRSVTGAIDWRGPVEPRAHVELATHSGALRVAIPADAGADVELRTLRGSVASDFPLDLPTTPGVRRAAITIGTGPAGTLRLETFDGSIELRREAR